MADDLRFVSASGSDIGASCMRLAFGNRASVVVDYGGGYDDESVEPDVEGWPAPDAVFITHAHFDHGGMVPRIPMRWPKVPIFMTEETHELLKWTWADTIKLANFRGDPPFTELDVERVNKHIQYVRFGQSRLLAAGTGASVDIHRAGHILGAACFTFRCINTGRRVCFTGDMGVQDRRLIPGADLQSIAEHGGDVLIRESTYAGVFGRERRLKDQVQLSQATHRVLGNDGRVIRPELSVDRLQDDWLWHHELGLTLDKSRPLYVIGGRLPTEVYMRYIPEAAPLAKMRRFVNRQHAEQALASNEPMIVLATSGMVAEGSPSFSWVRESLSRKNDAILFTNFVSPYMPGSAVLESKMNDWIWLPGGKVRRQCHVEQFYRSSHMDEEGAQELEKALRPKIVIHVHGARHRIDEYMQQKQGSGPLRIRAETGKEIVL